MSRSPVLLLLDLDGVCALERVPPGDAGVEIFRLHEDLSGGIAAVGCPVAVVTHRSRKEALRILKAIGVGRDQIRGVFSAEDFLFASLGRPLSLFRRGLLKSAALPAIERKFGVARANMAMIDDRDDNLEDLKANGLGLCLRAPSQSDEHPDHLLSFAFSEAVGVFSEWRLDDEAWTQVRRLTPLRIDAAETWRTGKNTRLSQLTLFNTVRVIARHARGWGRAARRT